MPVKEIQILKNILESKIFSVPGGTYSSCFIKEKQHQAKLKNIEIQHLTNNSLIIYPENGQGKDKRYSPLLSKSQNGEYNKSCDAVILCTHKNKNYEIYCELKSDKPKGADKQFKATQCFLNYIRNILEQFYSCQKIERKILKIVFNTKKQIIQTLDKRPCFPTKVNNAMDEIRYLCVTNNFQIGIGKIIEGC